MGRRGTVAARPMARGGTRRSWAATSGTTRPSKGSCSTCATFTERKTLERQLRQQAFHDPLTKLANRARFVDRLEHAMLRATRNGTPLAVLFMDLDNFKSVNDSLGHSAGDRMLIEVARRIAECLRPGDTAARFGGDEFAILLEDMADLDDAPAVAKRIFEEQRHQCRSKGKRCLSGLASASPPSVRPADNRRMRISSCGGRTWRCT